MVAADTLAWCLYKQGRFDEAATMIRRALRYNTPEPAIHFHAGMIHAALGDRAAARQSLYHALNLNPDFDPRDARVAADKIKELAGSGIR